MLEKQIGKEPHDGTITFRIFGKQITLRSEQGSLPTFWTDEEDRLRQSPPGPTYRNRFTLEIDSHRK